MKSRNNPSGRKAESQMASIKEVLLRQLSEQSELIHKLKTEGLIITEHDKYAYASPDGRTFRNTRPADQEMAAGWKYGKVRYQRTSGQMSPKHPRWSEYRSAKRRATTLLAARSLLKANDGGIPEKQEISRLVNSGVMRHHARKRGAQKSLAYSAYRLLRKVDNRLSKHPQKFSLIDEWAQERRQAAAAREKEVARG